MPKFIEEIIEMLERNEEFMEFEFPDFPEESPEERIEDAFIPENILTL